MLSSEVFRKSSFGFPCGQPSDKHCFFEERTKGTSDPGYLPVQQHFVKKFLTKVPAYGLAMLIRFRRGEADTERSPGDDLSARKRVSENLEKGAGVRVGEPKGWSLIHLPHSFSSSLCRFCLLLLFLYTRLVIKAALLDLGEESFFCKFFLEIPQCLLYLIVLYDDLHFAAITLLEKSSSQKKSIPKRRCPSRPLVFFSNQARLSSRAA